MSMDLAARFHAYADDFERSYADRDWARLAPYFASDAVYECKSPEVLAFRVEGRAAILARFESVTEAFDRRFAARSISFASTAVEGQTVTVTGLVLYTVADAPPLRLPFTEFAEYRGGEIIRLEDAATVEAFGEVTEWMARFADRLQR